MTKRLELYYCHTCGNLVEVFLEGNGELYCCGAPMELLKAKTTDEMAEKHVPVAEKTQDGKIEIKIGTIPHPMEQEHYITLIETVSDDKTCAHVKFLNPDEQPKAVFENINGNFTAREYCNIHGLWENSHNAEQH